MFCLTYLYLLIAMAVYKIKSEDKAAFLNRLEKLGVKVSSNDLKNKTELKGEDVISYFELNTDDPNLIQKVDSILNQSPAINQLSDMENNKKKMTKDELKEMVRQELHAILAEKKKVKGEEKKEKIDESEQLNEIDPAVMDAIQGIGGFAALAGTAFGIVKAGTLAAKKELVKKFQAAGKQVPDDKTLEKLAVQSFRTAMDRSTGAGLGADTPDVKI